MKVELFFCSVELVEVIAPNLKWWRWLPYWSEIYNILAIRGISGFVCAGFPETDFVNISSYSWIFLLNISFRNLFSLRTLRNYFTRKRTWRFFLGNWLCTKQNIQSNLYWAKVWCVFSNNKVRVQRLSLVKFSSLTELKGSSSLYLKVAIFYNLLFIITKDWMSKFISF